MDWADVNQKGLMKAFQELGQAIRRGELDAGRPHYALSLAHGVLQALHCGYDKLFAVELGVAFGGGLFDLCKAAHIFREMFRIEIDVWGLDNAAGLPPIEDYRDHPEIWSQGQYAMPDSKAIAAKLPPFGHLLIGDVGETIGELFRQTAGSTLGFVSLDLDYYSSTQRCLPMFLQDADRYLPALPVYVDDVEVLISYNSWCGEAAAIAEFNQEQLFRKIERKPNFNIHNFHVCHVLDHPIRTGKAKPRLPLEIVAL